MNFKNIFTLILMVATHVIYPMDNNDFSMCNLIKALNPNGSQTSYEETIKNIYANNQTVCSCVTHFMQEQEKTALDVISQNYTEQEWKAVNDVLDQIIKKHNENSSNQPKVVCESNFSLPFCKKVTEEYLKQGFKHNLFIGKGNSDLSNNAAVQNIDGHNNILWWGYKEDIDDSVLQSTLNHEFQHLRELHALKSGFFQYVGNSKNPLIEYREALEANADRIPAACGSAENAKCSYVDFFSLVQNGTRKRLNGEHLRKIQLGKINRNEANVRNNIAKELYDQEKLLKEKRQHVHPISSDRLKWATIIYKLKLAEEKYLQNKNEGTK